MTRRSRASAPFMVAVVLALAVAPATHAQPVMRPEGAPVPQRPMTARDLWAMGRVGAPAVSPDGRQVAYPVTRYDMDANRGRTDIWLVPVAGGLARQVTSAPNASSSSPAWSPDGGTLAFISSRGGDGAQVWLLPLEGGEARQLTRLEGGVGGPVWSRDGRHVLVTRRVWPEGDSLAARMRRLAETGSSARIYDELMYRHWDEWADGRRSHVFLVDAMTGDARDLTPGPYDTPPIALGGFQDYDLSPDGRELAFVRNVNLPTAVGTGNDVWLVDVAGGEPRRLTDNAANDVSPQYSPDGRWIAYLAMERAGFEADRQQIILYDRGSGERRSLTATLDRSVDAFVWTSDSRTLYFLAQDEIHRSVYRVPVTGGAPVQVTRDAYIASLAVTPDGSLVVGRQSSTLPNELFVLDANGRDVRQLTRTNDTLLSQIALQPAEPFWFDGAGGTRVHGFLVKPPHFDPSRAYPVVYLVHGGPQGAWSDHFHYRWNANMFAAPGYVAVLVNPRGSTGYGQRFTDEISGDWGGRVYEDLMLGLDHALETYPFLDAERVAAAGASYGGYMMNWFLANTVRFRALINHDGVYDLRSMYGSTEELWFPEWEFQGTPWSNPEGYLRFNPAEHAVNFETPMLVIHGGLDYRVPLEQGLQVFTALRRQGVPARLLYFPDEGHWVLQPKNALVWWETMLDWLDRWIGDGSPATD
jgi:dipeptidyl aminopeptidase/acylaminoacyl peptidase